MCRCQGYSGPVQVRLHTGHSRQAGEGGLPAIKIAMGIVVKAANQLLPERLSPGIEIVT